MARAQRRKALDQFFVVGRLVLLACLVLLFMRLPVLSNVLDLLGTFFHELGHGLFAFLTGGQVLQLALSWDGSGFLRRAGGFTLITAWMGYAGTMAAGLALYVSMTRQQLAGRTVLWVCAGLIAVVILFWAKDWTTRAIGLMLAGFLTGLGFLLRLSVGNLGQSHRQLFPGKLVVRFIGLTLIIGSMVRAWDLIGFSEHNDSRTLAEHYFLFPFVWIASWELFGAACIWGCYQMDVAEERRRVAANA